MIWADDARNICFLCTGRLSADDIADAPVTEWVTSRTTHHECRNRARHGHRFDRELHAAGVRATLRVVAIWRPDDVATAGSGTMATPTKGK